MKVKHKNIKYTAIVFYCFKRGLFCLRLAPMKAIVKLLKLACWRTWWFIVSWASPLFMRLFSGFIGSTNTIIYSLTISSLSPVGEPLNDEAWWWYHNVVGEGKCTVIDNWWQTGTYITLWLVFLIARLWQDCYKRPWKRTTCICTCIHAGCLSG